MRIYADMVDGITVDKQAMRQAAMEGFATATDLADYLVKKGMPFREAHEAVSRAVRRAVEKDVDLAQLGIEELKRFSNLIGVDVLDNLSLEGSLAARDHIGGTAPVQVRAAIVRARAHISRQPPVT